jgi:hypothetical protein
MSDQGVAPAQSAVVANATQALAIKELGEEIGGIKKQFKALWIAVGVIGTITLILAILTILPRFGVRVGGAGFPGRTGAGMNGQQFDGGTGAPQQTPPGQ